MANQIDRSRFKATKVADFKEQDKLVNKLNYSWSDRNEFHTIEKGSNKFRIYPSKDGSPFITARSVSWIPKLVEYEKDGEKISEWKKRPIFNSKIHSDNIFNFEGKKSDLIEEYVKLGQRILTEEITDKDILEKKIALLIDWKLGIGPKLSWVCYADLISGTTKKFALLEIPVGVKNKINEIAIVEDAGSAIETDPFTDPDDGKAIIILYNPDEKQAKDKYKVTLEFRGNYALTDEDLLKLDSADSVEKIYKNCFKRKDLELQISGLKKYDEDHKIGVFDTDDFQNIVDHFKSQLNDEVDEEEEEESELGSEESEDSFSSMGREELKKYIKINGLQIIVRQNMTDDDIRNSIRNFVSELEEEIDEVFEQEPGGANISEEKTETRAEAKKMSKLEEVKKGLKKGK